ncbi:FxsA family protein [Pasteurellaceae bacterium 20609_3]|uniref:FxsA family protein n=1 Tax=Spirabiliibacterium mucosae TaxID=28156 RepID=UPI001AACEA2F|nr:FxsA family protein [Spirabiliibacterium mucosae]MBE2898272.1 FxsA family protein [Spirabiliibacterium mucosae]
MPILIFFAIIALYVYLELTLLVSIGSAIGVLPLLLLLLLSSLVGLFLIRMRGWYTMMKLQQQLRAGEIPSRSLFQGAIWITAGVLFFIPGFLSDIFAILLLLPTTSLLLERWLIKRVKGFAFVQRFGHFKRQGQSNNAADDTVFEAEYAKKADDDRTLK